MESFYIENFFFKIIRYIKILYLIMLRLFRANKNLKTFLRFCLEIFKYFYYE